MQNLVLKVLHSGLTEMRSPDIMNTLVSMKC